MLPTEGRSMDAPGRELDTGRNASIQTDTRGAKCLAE
jgi:hypothetical protein